MAIARPMYFDQYDQLFDTQRQYEEYVRARSDQQKAAIGGLGGLGQALGVGWPQRDTQATRPQEPPKPNPVLLLTGDDE